MAISGNYIDSSNLSMAIRELEFTGAEDPRVKVVLDVLRLKLQERVSMVSFVSFSLSI